MIEATVIDMPAIGAVFPLIPPGTSEPLAQLLRQWRDARRWGETTEDDDDATRACEFFDAIEESIASFPAASFSDLAAKLAISAYTLNGAGVLGRSGITPDGNLLIRSKPEWNAASEHLLVQAAEDALRLSGSENRHVSE